MRLALLGGEPVRNRPFPTFPVSGKEDLSEIKEVLNNVSYWNMLYNDRKHREAEEKFSALCRVKHAITCSNGTHALMIALEAVGVGCGDEVITTPYTCWATVEAILRVNAIPVFADIEPDTYCIDPVKVEESITPRTKAIVVVHFGTVCNMDRLCAIANKHSLALIEDCALAHGSEWRGKAVGTMGDLGSYSFGCGKLVQCGEGGAVITNDDTLAAICRSLRNLGGGLDESDRLGWNFRLSGILAALLVSQLEKYPGELERRNENGLYLTERLNQIPGIRVLRRRSEVTKFGYCHFIFRFNAEEFGIDRDTFIKAVQAEGIPVRLGYITEPLNKHRIFQNSRIPKCPLGCKYYNGEIDYSKLHLPVAEQACDESVWIPQNVLLGTRKDMDDVIHAIEKVYENSIELKVGKSI